MASGSANLNPPQIFDQSPLKGTAAVSVDSEFSVLLLVRLIC
jgi:hypothetical protein